MGLFRAVTRVLIRRSDRASTVELTDAELEELSDECSTASIEPPTLRQTLLQWEQEPTRPGDVSPTLLDLCRG